MEDPHIKGMRSSIWGSRSEDESFDGKPMEWHGDKEAPEAEEEPEKEVEEEEKEVEEEEKEVEEDEPEKPDPEDVVDDSEESASRLGNTDLRPEQFDDECSWSYGQAHCTPPDFCEYSYKFGDIHLGQSCRAKEDIDVLAARRYFADRAAQKEAGENSDETDESDDEDEVEETIGGLSDSDCTWDYGGAMCTPQEICEYSYEFGDIHLGQSCRLKSKGDVEASLKSLKEYLGHDDDEDDDDDDEDDVPPSASTGPEAEELNLAKQDEEFKKQGEDLARDAAKEAVDNMDEENPESVKDAIDKVNELKEKESVVEDAESEVEDSESNQLSPTEQKEREQELAEAKDEAAKRYLECEADCDKELLVDTSGTKTCCNGDWYRYLCFCYAGTCCA